MDDNVKLTLVEQALQSNYSRKKLDRVSLRQFVNRLLLLTQKPRIFLFYKKDKKRGGWVYSFSTHGDVLYKKQFEEQIKNKLHQQLDKYCSYKKPQDPIWPDEPHEIGNTGFGIIIVAIKAKTTKTGREITFTSPNKLDNENNIIDNIEYALLNKLWCSFLGCEFSKTLGVEARLKKKLEQIGSNPTAEKNSIETSNHQSIDHTLSITDQAFINEQLDYLSEIINDCYKDVCETPLICNQGKTPPNIFFFVRYYDSPDTINRFKNGLKDGNDPYPYSLKIIIPKAQKEHLLTTLKSIAESDINEIKSGVNTWNYKYKRLPGYKKLYSKNNHECDSCYPVPKLDFEFWQRIKQGQFDEILTDLQQPFTQEARSFVDPSLMTGFIHYRSGVYQESGLERVTEKAQKLDFESSDIRRLVYLHYLFSAAAPDSNHENLGTMTVPLNVANQPYVAVVQAIVTKDENDPDYTDRISWPQNYHFFTDVARHCVRGLRYHSKIKYLQQIEKVVYEAFKKYLQVSSPTEIYINFENAQNQINKELTLLCRVWPYPHVSIKIRQSIIQPNEFYIPIINTVDKGTGLYFSIVDNPFFNSTENNADLNFIAKSDSVLLTNGEVKRAFIRTLHYLEELISISLLKIVQKH